jgi:hypothetical protein
MRRFALIALALLGACATQQHRNQPLAAEEKLTAARDLVKLTVTPDRVETQARAFTEEYRSRFPTPPVVCKTASNVEACEATDRKFLTEVDAILDKFVEQRRAQTSQLVEVQARRTAEIYSDEELAAAKAFYTSAAGRSILAKADAIASEFAKEQYAIIRPLEDQLLHDLQVRSLEFSNEFAKSFGKSALPPATPATPS